VEIMVFVAVVTVCPSFNGQCIPFELDKYRAKSHAECVEMMPELRSEVAYRIRTGALPYDAFMSSNACERR
jgi:hypothetical protein